MRLALARPPRGGSFALLGRQAARFERTAAAGKLADRAARRHRLREVALCDVRARDFPVDHHCLVAERERLRAPKLVQRVLIVPRLAERLAHTLIDASALAGDDFVWSCGVRERGLLREHGRRDRHHEKSSRQAHSAGQCALFSSFCSYFHESRERPRCGLAHRRCVVRRARMSPERERPRPSLPEFPSTIACAESARTLRAWRDRRASLHEGTNLQSRAHRAQGCSSSFEAVPSRVGGEAAIDWQRSRPSSR